MNLLEKTLAQQIQYKGFLVNVRLDKVAVNQGQVETIREVVEHPGGVCIAALTERNTFLMVEQYRYAQQENTLEFVAGKREKNEEAHITALRELQEEAGYIAKDVTYLGEVYPSPAYLSEKIQLFFAKDLVHLGEQSLDAYEYLNLIEMDLETIIEQIESNMIKDLKTIALAYRLQSLI